MLSIVAIVGRVIQCIFSVVVLGLSVAAIAAQVYGSAPVTPKYIDFVGAFGIIVAAVGIISLYIQRISPKIPLALDALLALFFLAGGIAWAVGLKGINCNNVTDAEQMVYNPLLNWGTVDFGGQTSYGVGHDTSDPNVVLKRLMDNCKKSFSNEIINFIGFAWSLALVGLDFVLMRKGGVSGTYV